MSLELNILTKTKTLCKNLEVNSVFLPTVKGQINVISGHASVITKIVPGILSYEAGGQSKEMKVDSHGVCKILNNQITLLLDSMFSV